MNEYSAKMNEKKQTFDAKSIASSHRSKSTIRSKKGKKQKKNRSKSLNRAHFQKLRKIVTDVGPAVKQLETSKRSLALAKDGHFLTGVKDSKVDVKVIQNEVDMMCKELALAKETMRAGYGNRPFKIKLWRETSSASSSGSALTTVTTIDLTQFTEWSSVIALFDLGKCTGLTVHFGVQMSHATAAAETYGNLAFDPENNGVFGSLVTSLASVYKNGPFKVSAANIGVATHYSSTPSGMHILRIPAMPPIMPDQAAANQIYTGDWFDTANATVIVGYLKPYINSQAGGTSAISYLIEAHMEFKMRS